ncbi:expansin [Klebsormidium nitens]|uniref:Expansin n=1 Tax=Klebsormidium nitens TaxID=105231 RepID=A0A1Y1I9Y7_KLENI|nr:expansin [Klebsormidium nitens]|eukprot:GAQ85527.1 expansin [Klebsormidium nitens]
MLTALAGSIVVTTPSGLPIETLRLQHRSPSSFLLLLLDWQPNWVCSWAHIMAASLSLLLLAPLVLLCSLLVGLPAAAALDIFNPGWTAGQATFYPDAAQGGQCRYFGYYGNAIVAIGNEYWANGGACGSCFELQCDPSNNGNGNAVYSSGCRPGLPVLKVTLSDITDECYADNCGNTGYHFDLDPSKYAEFANFAADGGGIVYIKWRRVPCNYQKNLLLRAHEQTNPWWLAFTVLDQNGAGDIDRVEWSSATRGWQIAPRLAYSGNTFTIGGYPYEPLSVRITDSEQ